MVFSQFDQQRAGISFIFAHARKLSFRVGLCSALVAPNLAASWLDDDYWCRVYGCVVVTDGAAFDIYDVYNFATGRTVSTGTALIAWSGNPYQGAGAVDTVTTGSLTPTGIPSAGEGSLLAWDLDNDGTADLQASDANNSGYLDLGDSFSQVPLSMSTSVANQDDAYHHSLYIASRTDFYLMGSASIQTAYGELATHMSPSQVGFEVSFTQSGNDEGFDFGSASRNPRFVADAGISNLQDFWGSTTRLAEFRNGNGTRARSATHVEDQAVRLDMKFRMPRPDFSFGTGEVQYAVHYGFYNR